MKLLMLFSTILILASILNGDHVPQGLRGCPKMTVISEALGTLERQPWNKLSADRVISVWPNQFDELKCNSEAPCRLLVTKGRVIGGHCECCEAFYFSIEKNSGAADSEHLTNVIIHYTMHDKVALVSAAKQLASGFELPADKAALVGQSPDQRFEWTKRTGDIEENFLAEVKIMAIGPNWELYFATSVD